MSDAGTNGSGARRAATGFPATLALIARVLLGVWFVYSGGVKIFGSGLDRFTRDVANYQIVNPPWDAVAAYSVPWLELIAGVCLMLGILRRGAILTIAGLVVVFSISVGWAWSKGLDISCGCHGGDAPIQYWNKALEFAGYFFLLAWLWWMEGRTSNAKHRTSNRGLSRRSMEFITAFIHLFPSMFDV